MATVFRRIADGKYDGFDFLYAPPGTHVGDLLVVAIPDENVTPPCGWTRWDDAPEVFTSVEVPIMAAFVSTEEPKAIEHDEIPDYHSIATRVINDGTPLTIGALYWRLCNPQVLGVTPSPPPKVGRWGFTDEVEPELT